jgi:hypothetical protein
MDRLIEWLLAASWQSWPVGAHRTDAIASAIAGDGNCAVLVGAPDRHALLRQDVQYLVVRMAKGIIGTGRDDTNLRLYLLHKGQ